MRAFMRKSTEELILIFQSGTLNANRTIETKKSKITKMK